MGCAQGTRGGRRVRSAMEWQGGGRVSVAKTRVGWPEEPHLRGMLEVRFRRIDDGNFYCFACWLIYHAALARLRRDTAHVQPARNLQGVAYAPGSAQHERSVGTVSPTLGRRPQLHRPDSCMEHQQIKPAHQSPRKQRMRVAVKPSSLKSEVGIRVLTPTPVTQVVYPGLFFLFLLRKHFIT